jgi:hypothetical protein
MAIEKEMKNVMPAFEFRDDDKMPVGYKKIQCHMVFDVKIGDLTRKTRFVLMAMRLILPKNLHSQQWFQGIQLGYFSYWQHLMI